jgi:DNA-binding response OmpR family regulator
VVLDAGDAETGLSIAREETPDLIFLDIVLPGMSGFAALRRMRRDPRTQRIPVIIISGTEQAIGRSYAKRIGADDFMKKPFSRRDLFIHIEMLIVEERLPRLDAAPGKRQPGVVDPADVPTTPTPWKNEAVAEDPPNVPITGTPASEARRRLAAMGLQYTSQEQFSTAIKRRDKEIVKLFVIGRGVKVQR